MNVSPREAHQENDARGKWHASRSGTPWGVKPTDNVPTIRSRTDKQRATPATYADERNLRLKRREFDQVKAVDTLDQKVTVYVPHCLHIDEGSSTKHPAESRASYGLR